MSTPARNRMNARPVRRVHRRRATVASHLSREGPPVDGAPQPVPSHAPKPFEFRAKLGHHELGHPSLGDLGFFPPIDVPAVLPVTSSLPFDSTSNLLSPVPYYGLQPCVFRNPWYTNPDSDSVEFINPWAQHQSISGSTCDGFECSQAESSVGSTLSPVPTEIPSATDGLSAVSSGWSRGPSPLGQHPSPTEQTHPDHSERSDTSTSKAEEFLCLGPDCALQFPSEAELNQHIRLDHGDGYPCSWGSCAAPALPSREALSWHVKVQHLLVCPVVGCSEGEFSGAGLLGAHLRVAHPGAKPGAKMKTSDEPLAGKTPQPVLPMAPVIEEEDISSGTPRWDAVNDPAMKMALSIATSKRKCREQLRAVIERRMRKLGGTPRSVGTPRSADSPQDMTRSRTPRILDYATFPLVWEHGVLPFLVEFVPKWCGPGHVISVTRGKTPSAKRICLMTRKKISRARKLFIAVHVRDLLPATWRNHASFWFSTGKVNRLGWANGVSRDMPDDLCKPRNPFCYKSPCMGDSIGTAEPGDGESTSTLGPCLTIGGGRYWLANFHPFIDTYRKTETITVEHPSPRDRGRCVETGHDALTASELVFTLGNLIATSGVDLKTARLSHDIYWEEMDKEPPLVVTDWTLVSSRTRQANMLRRFPTTTPRLAKDTPVTATASITPGANVISTGRTSGFQRGQVCEIPAYVSGDSVGGNAIGRATREWFVEEPFPYDNEDAWVRGGIGVEGDSGAAIVDADTNALIGQLWGRNKYFGIGPRQTFFTPISDILDDIQEKCGQQSRPQLPQYRDESERWAVYPLCRECFDMSTYLDSRRGSAQSLPSMIERHPGEGGPLDDHELTSIENVSELATPRDHTYWLRHTGPEDAGLSFTSTTSPAPMGGFAFGAQAESPRVAGIKSPWMMDYDDDDLFDAEYGSPGATGKRAALPLIRSASQSSSKRPRIM